MTTMRRDGVPKVAATPKLGRASDLNAPASVPAHLPLWAPGEGAHPLA
jgi:hypothetical protein